MKLRTRLQRLEQRTPPRAAALRPPLPASAEEEQIVAYLRGEGPQPPCPEYVDPSQRDSHLRTDCCLLQRVRGALGHGEYLPNMTEDERREVDELVKVIAQFDWAPPWFKEP